jgi:hypothetical protein
MFEIAGGIILGFLGIVAIVRIASRAPKSGHTPPLQMLPPKGRTIFSSEVRDAIARVLVRHAEQVAAIAEERRVFRTIIAA